MIDYENKRMMECEECGSRFEVKHEMGTQYIPQYCTFCAGEILPKEERIDYEEDVLHWQISESCYNSSMTRDMKYRLARYTILGFCFGGIWTNRPEMGLDHLSYGSGLFYAYIFLFVFLLVRWCIRWKTK